MASMSLPDNYYTTNLSFTHSTWRRWIFGGSLILGGVIFQILSCLRDRIWETDPCPSTLSHDDLQFIYFSLYLLSKCYMALFYSTMAITSRPLSSMWFKWFVCFYHWSLSHMKRSSSRSAVFFSICTCPPWPCTYVRSFTFRHIQKETKTLENFLQTGPPGMIYSDTGSYNFHVLNSLQ